MSDRPRRGSIHYGWIIVAVGVLIVFGSLGLARFGFTMILPTMKGDLGLTEVQAGDLAAGNNVGYLAMSLVCGILAARFGPRAVISIFMVVVAAAMIMTGLAGEYPTALIGRTLAGVGSGGANVPAMGLISAWFVREKRGLATGIVVSGSSLGLLVTGKLIPAILEHYGTAGWRVCWYVLGALALMIAAVGWVTLCNHPHERGLEPFGNKSLDTDTRPSEKRWSTVYRTPAVWHLAAVYLMFGFSYVIYTTFFTHYLTGEMGLTTETAGSLWSGVGAFSIASGFLWGTVSDRLGRKYGLALVFFFQALCFGVFGLWHTAGGIYLSAFFFALTAWSIPAIIAAACGDIFGSRLAPAAFGFLTIFFGIGQVAGPFTAGRIAQAVGSYAPAFTTAAIAAMVGSGLSLLLGRNPQVSE